MGSFSNFAQNMNWIGLVSLLITAAASLLCITIHELSHGFVAYCLGDHTAKQAGRLTLNPIRHIDPLGLLMLIVAKVGWAKPVPVDMRNFKHSKQGMAITALAGPISNFVTALAALALSSLLLRVLPNNDVRFWILAFLSYIALLSVGLGLFNLIPISPLDGSKVLYAFLPDKWYYRILHYERYVMILVMVLTLSGFFRGPLSFFMNHVLVAFCAVTRYPIEALFYHINFMDMLRQM